MQDTKCSGYEKSVTNCRTLC